MTCINLNILIYTLKNQQDILDTNNKYTSRQLPMDQNTNYATKTCTSTCPLVQNDFRKLHISKCLKFLYTIKNEQSLSHQGGDCRKWRTNNYSEISAATEIV
eukprot:TRINITY_DN7824_c1_g3_i2.p7 TRINITY_DN7824_c1_g3~~TRINITY_DN7824_c1_g3_i2.p7  ORF type:complete len:102 (-),score=1.98 TRINITY_DN7824_c1_g3_i2:902-1207(-)